MTLSLIQLQKQASLCCYGVGLWVQDSDSHKKPFSLAASAKPGPTLPHCFGRRSLLPQTTEKPKVLLVFLSHLVNIIAKQSDQFQGILYLQPVH